MGKLEGIAYDAAYRVRWQKSNLQQTSIDLLAHTLEASLPCPNASVLSLGCGNGKLEESAIQQAFGDGKGKALHYHGVDVIECSLEDFSMTASAVRQASTELADAQQFLETTDDQWDVILLSHALYFFQEPESIIKAASRRLSRNGVIIIVNNDCSGVTQVKDAVCGQGIGNRYVTTEYLISRMPDHLGMRFTRTTKTAFADFTDVEPKSIDSLLLVSFMLGIDIASLDSSFAEEVIEELLGRCVTREGRFGIEEPISAISMEGVR